MNQKVSLKIYLIFLILQICYGQNRFALWDSKKKDRPIKTSNLIRVYDEFALFGLVRKITNGKWNRKLRYADEHDE